MTLSRNGRERTFNVRVTGESSSRTDQSYVVTLDDITDLVSAQRTSAWGDVARRIAHEIKNPLTPIQLSAERLKRRYGRVITEGREVFDQCTDTIIRQVDDIKRMVDEFSSFARMPRATHGGGRSRQVRATGAVLDACRPSRHHLRRPAAGGSDNRPLRPATAHAGADQRRSRMRPKASRPSKQSSASRAW